MSKPSNAQREAVIRLMADVWDDFVSDTGNFPDDFTILPRRRLQFVAGRWAGMVADALYGVDGPLAGTVRDDGARERIYRRALQDIAEGTVVVFDKSEECEVKIWMEEDELREIARKTLAASTPPAGDVPGDATPVPADREGGR